MKTVFRTSAAVFIGLFVVLALVIAVEQVSGVVHPVPKGFTGTTEETCEHVRRYPSWVLAVVVPLWAFTAFAGTWTAQKLGNLYSAAIVGLLLLAALLANLVMLPYPTWFKVMNLLVIPAALFTGSRRSTRRNNAPAPEVN